MLFRIRSKIAYWRFDRAVQAVLQTRPVAPPASPPRPLTVVSMVANRHVAMYLVSLKAFLRRIGPGGRVVAIVDRDMPQASQDTLRAHVPGIELVILEEIEVGICQRGGTWERIVYCLDRAERGEYVVQLDADAIACGPDLDEAAACIAQGVSFTIADSHQIVSLEESASFARTIEGNYIGTTFEQKFDQYPDAANLLYVRGSSGFAGFAPGAFPRARIEEFHREGERLVGEARWREWGTEQCASNFAVANSPGAVILPYPAYTSYHPGAALTGVKLYHFIGSFRFDNGFFARLCQREIEAPA